MMDFLWSVHCMHHSPGINPTHYHSSCALKCYWLRHILLLTSAWKWKCTDIFKSDVSYFDSDLVFGFISHVVQLALSPKMIWLRGVLTTAPRKNSPAISKRISNHIKTLLWYGVGGGGGGFLSLFYFFF